MGTFSFWLRVLLFWPFVTYAKEHQRCLRNIDRLERDLFPEWFPKLGWGKAEIEQVFPMEPGAIIEIRAGGRLEWLTTPMSNYSQIDGNFYPLASSGRSHTKITWEEQILDEIAAL